MTTTSTLDRRTFLRVSAAAGAGSLLALTACGMLGQGQGTTSGQPVDVTFQLSWVKDVEWASSFIADDRGYYKQEGLNVTLEPGGPDIDNLLPVVNGNALVTTRNSLSVAVARAQGAPLKIVGAVMQKNPFAVMSLKDNPIKTPKDLEGKRFGVSTINATVYRAFTKLANIDASKITVIPVQFDAAPLLSNQVDALLTFGAKLPVQLEMRNIAVVTFLLSDYGYLLYNQCYAVREDALAAKRDALVRFMRAEIRGWQENIKDPTIAARLTVDKYGKSLGLDYESELRTNQLYAQQLLQTPTTAKQGLLWMGDEDVAANIRTFEASDVVGNARDVFTNEILQEIYKGSNKI